MFSKIIQSVDAHHSIKLSIIDKRCNAEFLTVNNEYPKSFAYLIKECVTYLKTTNVKSITYIVPKDMYDNSHLAALKKEEYDDFHYIITNDIAGFVNDFVKDYGDAHINI